MPTLERSFTQQSAGVGAFSTAHLLNPVDASKIEAQSAHNSARIIAHRAAWDAYNFSYRPALAVAEGEGDPNVQVNFARMIVEKSVAFLFGKPLQLDIELGDAEPTPEEEWLAEAWDANGGMGRLQMSALNASVTGHTFLKLMPPNPVEYGHEYPRIVVLNPDTVEVVNRPDDYEMVDEYIISYDYVGMTGKSVYCRQRIKRDQGGWVIVDETAMSEDKVYLPTKDPERWPYEWAPIDHAQNVPMPNVFYGRSDIEPDVLHLIDRLNFTLSNWSKTVRMHAHPRQWGSGFTADQLKVAPDRTVILPDEKAKLNLLEMQSEFVSTDLLYTRIKEALHEIARIPKVATASIENIGNLAGVALHILYQPLLELTGAKRLTQGPLVQRISARMLEMGGKGKGTKVYLSWPELLPADPLLERQALQLDRIMRIGSRQTISRKLGYTWDVEQKRISDEEKADMEAGVMPNETLGGPDSVRANSAGDVGQPGGTKSSAPTTDGQPNHRTRKP